MTLHNAYYYIEIQTSHGVPLVQVNDFSTLRYARAVNGMGSLFVELFPTFDVRLLSIDGRILVYRNGRLELDTIWFIRSWAFEMRENGVQVIEVNAYAAIELLERRIVAYYAGSDYAEKSDYADDMMKEIVDENFGSAAADVDRDISDWLSIDADLSLAPTVGKAFARRNILAVLGEIAELSAKSGVPLFFDIVPDGLPMLTFRTFINQRGSDRSMFSGLQTIFSADYGNLTHGRLTYDYREEINDVYAAGDGERELRDVVQEEDTGRVNLSPLNRREKLYDARSGVSAATLSYYAKMQLQIGRPRKVFVGGITETEQCRYSVDWNWGDRVQAQYMGEAFECIISNISVDLTDGVEKISTRLESTEYM